MFVDMNASEGFICMHVFFLGAFINTGTGQKLPFL